MERKQSATATPQPYGYRASARLYPLFNCTRDTEGHTAKSVPQEIPEKQNRTDLVDPWASITDLTMSVVVVVFLYLTTLLLIPATEKGIIEQSTTKDFINLAQLVRRGIYSTLWVMTHLLTFAARYLSGTYAARVVVSKGSPFDSSLFALPPLFPFGCANPLV